MPEQRVLKLRSQLNAVPSELIVKGDLVKLNWPICVIRELSLCCRLAVLRKISRGFGTKRPLLGLLLGAIGLNFGGRARIIRVSATCLRKNLSLRWTALAGVYWHRKHITRLG